MSKNSKPALGFIFITLLLDVIGFGIIIPVIPKYISHLIGSDLSHASIYSGWLMFSFSVMQFLFSPLIGSLSDRFGRRPVLLTSLFGFGINYLIIAFAPTIGLVICGSYSGRYNRGKFFYRLPHTLRISALPKKGHKTLD